MGGHQPGRLLADAAKHPRGRTEQAQAQAGGHAGGADLGDEVAAALRADTATLPAWVGIDLGAQGYSVIKVNKVQARVAPAADMAKQELQ